MHLPIPLDQPWEVIQDVDNPEGSHKGYAAFCWDLILAGKPQSESDGARFYAAAPGTVDAVKEDQDTGGQSNLISVKQAPLEFCDYLHLVQHLAVVADGATVGFGQHLADVGDPGTGRSEEAEIQVYGWSYEDLRARYDVLWELGWRLRHLSPFVL